MLIDTHLHIIDQSALSYPWLAGVDALNRDFLYADYARQARRAGISQAMHMEVDVDPARIDNENAYVAGLSKKPDSLITAAIAACRPEEEGFAVYLEEQRANPFVRGFRRPLHVVPDEVSEQPIFRENIKRLSGTGLTFDLCVLPRQLDKAIALADTAPDVQFILDHCGVPDIAGDAREPWRSRIEDIARRSNVTAKISGVVAYADQDDWTIDTLRPWVEHVVACFGWDRIVWGSDWPVCTLGGGLATWVAATHALFANASADEREKLFAGNARRIWRL
ncbi:amidohydrolase family protein [Chelativorans sp. YIM 93263]|uniref:amidohydrolase family protein n=1 Tax=Chelativorans sp. YIM 93263 TaxID=2906648 RepID=UPI002379F576|nr:amidohydrolase [Chelativorans sp. YIM 93263]